MQSRFFFLLILTLSFLVKGWGQINKNNDWQIWALGSVGKGFNNNMAVRIDTEYRFGDDASKLYFAYIQGFIEYEPSSFCLVAPGYRQEWIRSSTHSWRKTYNPLVDTTFIFRRSYFFITDRNRVQYQFLKEETNRWIYRNRFRITFTTEVKGIGIDPFIDNEIFFVEKRGINQNRASIGCLFIFNELFQSRIFYLLRHLKREGHWTHQNVMNLHLYFAF